MEPVYDIVWIFFKVFAAHGFLFLALPAFALWPCIRGRSLANKLATCCVAGHFALVQLVFLLAFLRLCVRPLFIALVLGLALVVRLYLEKGRLRGGVARLGATAARLLGHEYGARLFAQRLLQRGRRAFRRLCRGIMAHLSELLAFCVLGALVLRFYMQWGINYVTFAAPDEEVHLYYIQRMIEGVIYTEGVYPFGFHNAGAAIVLFFGIRTVDFIRTACLVSILYIMGGLYLWLRQLFRFRLGVIVALAVYNLGLFYSASSTGRYQYALPQEYAMVFLCPMLLFFFAYLRHRRRRDLLLFAASLSLVFSCHFYTALIAGLALLVYGLLYLAHILRRRMLLPLAAAVLGFMLVAALPLGIGRLMGREWEQAMDWAVGVLNNKDIYSEEEQEQASALDAYFNSGEQVDMAAEETASGLAGIYEVFTEYLFHNRIAFLAFCCLLPFAAGLTAYYCVRRRRSGIGRQLAGLWFLGLVLALLACAKPLGLPTVIDAQRTAIFFAYFTVWVIASPLELLYLGLYGRRLQGMLPVLTCACLCTALALQQATGLYRRSSYASQIQTRPAMQCTLNIMETFEPFTYTIISPTQETGMLLASGYHYELIDLLLAQEFYRGDMELYIPTPHIFLYVEMRPIEFGGSVDVTLCYDEYIDRPGIAAGDADAYFITEMEPSNYYKRQRFTVMARADAWIQQYQLHHADSAEVYYVDSELIVYHIEQNAYALHNLALDYGYNSRLTS